MKKYKLLKRYPSLHSSWYEGMEVGQGDRKGSFADFSPCSGHMADVKIPYSEVVNNPEFWEEVLEKDYEILSYYQESNVHGKYIYFKSHENWNYIEKQNYKIHSVKRKSDGEVFTIGDKVRIKKLQCDGSFVIDEFYFDCNNDKLLCNGKCAGNGHVSITKIEHSKSILLTTEDGVDIYEGDELFCIKNSQIKHVYNITFTEENVKYFSNRKSAEYYLLLNERCLSLNDVGQFYKKLLDFSNGNSKGLLELVKSRL